MEFRKRWISFLHKLATGTKITRSLLTPIGVVIFGAITTLFVLVALFVDKLLGLSCFLPEAVRVLISIPLMVVGMWLNPYRCSTRDRRVRSLEY